MKPLVSILIPAYNAERWISEALQSAIAQTWPHKEIIVVDDGSSDQTVQVAKEFAAKGVTLVVQGNQGAPAARNHAYQICKGDFIQWLDADDLLAPDKIERQLAALEGGENGKVLLGGSVGHFHYRTSHAQFASLPATLEMTPIEWFLAEMLGEIGSLQTGSWLTSRELIDATGPWDVRFLCGQDANYFPRVVVASHRVRYVPTAKAYYRFLPSGSVSDIRTSPQKAEWMVRQSQNKVQRAISLEDSERVRNVCLIYLQRVYGQFYPDWPSEACEVRSIAEKLGGQLQIPPLRWKFRWMAPIFGWNFANRAQNALPKFKRTCFMCWDKMMYKLEGGQAAGNRAANSTAGVQGK